MKILIYGLNYRPELTGIGKYTGEMAEWLAKRGHKVIVVTAPPYYPKWQIEKEYSYHYQIENLNGIKVFRCPLYIPRKPKGLTRILQLLSFSFSSLFIIVYLSTWRPHVVINIIPSIFSAFVALLGTLLCDAKSWLHIQDFELDAAFNLGILRASRLKKIARYAERLIFNRFDCVSTISVSMLKRLYQKKGIEKSTTLLLPNWVDTDKILPLMERNSLRDDLGFNQEHIVALYSGNMGKKQGLEIILDVARKIETNKDIRFVLCGEGPAKPNLMSLSSGLANVCFLPLQPRQKLNLLLNLADIHLLPQKPEAADLVMPSKLTGIFASGKPVVAIANPGTEIGQVIKGRGILVRPGDVEGFVNAIVWLANHPDERKKLGVAGRTYAVDRLDINNILTQFETTLNDFINTLKL